MSEVKLYHGDCLKVLLELEAGIIDAIICDLPYGKTNCGWDAIIPFEPMWRAFEYVGKKRTPMVLFGSQPFTSMLVMSKLEWFKYDLIWHKSNPTGGLNANKMQLRIHEDILVFYQEPCTYNVIKFEYKSPRFKIGEENTITKSKEADNNVYGRVMERPTYIETGTRYPLSVIYCGNSEHNGRHRVRKLHPTQKPVALLEYLVRTYTNPGDTVLDATMGSCTTGVACVNTGRNFIGIEKEREYYDIACKRIEEARMQTRMAL